LFQSAAKQGYEAGFNALSLTQSGGQRAFLNQVIMLMLFVSNTRN